MKRKTSSSRKAKLASYYRNKKKQKQDKKERNEILHKQELNQQYKCESCEKKKKNKEHIR